ncbi:CDP-glycerol glycerophosphotransferase family protein [Aeromonas veronii]
MISFIPLVKSKYYHYKKDWENAANELEKAIPSQFAIRSWHYQLGFYYSKLKRWHEAEKNLAIATNKDNTPYRWSYRHVIALENIDKKQKAKEIIKVISIKNGNDAKKHFESGMLLMGFSRFSAAEEAFRFAAELDDSNSLYYDKLAECLNKQYKWWQEVEALYSALDLSPQDESIAKRLGAALERMENFDSAIDIYTKVIAVQPNDAELNYSIGFCFECIGQVDNANKYYDLAIEFDTSVNAKKFGIGAFHKKRGLWPNAALAFEQQVTQNPNDADLLYVTGMAFDRSYQWSKAESYYKRAISIKGGQAAWNFRLALCLERQKKWGQAAAKYEVACRASVKHNSHYFYRLGYCLYNKKEFDKSCQAFLMMRLSRGHQYSKFNYKIFSTKPWTAEEHFQRGHEYEVVNNDLFSSECFLNATQRNNNYSSDYYYYLGYSLFKQGNFKGAADAFIESRILTRPYGVDLVDFDKNDKIKRINSYIEYYNRLKIIDNAVLFESFHGASVSCNPLAIYQHMNSRAEFKSFVFIWVLNKGVKVPESIRRKHNVIVVHRGSDLYLRYLASAKYLINNVTFPEYYIRKEGQVYLNTWHGTPIKYLGKDIKDSFLAHYNVARNFLHATHIISQNKYTSDILIDRYHVRNTCDAIIQTTGYPRTDITIKLSPEGKNSLRRTLGIKESQKVILYAPTWRGEHGKATFDTSRLVHDLTVISQQGYKVLFRGHHMIEHHIAKQKLPVQIVPSDIDTNKILAIVDVLITDYSSIAFDFLPTLKPVIYYAYDLNEYLTERGLYIALDELPGSVCYTIDELSKELPNAVNFKASKAYIKAVNEYCAFEDGLSSKRVVDLVFLGINRVLDSHKSIQKKNILIYAGPFIPNGIATSANNLLNHIDYSKYNVSLAVDVRSINGFPERLHEIGKIPEQVEVLGYKGDALFDLEESWVKSKFDALKAFHTNEMEDIYLNAFYRDFIRNFGQKGFDAIVNFEGYDKKWVSLFSSVPKDSVKRKIVYQHSDMLSEFKTRFPYLKCNFSLYKNFDAIVSVSDATRNHNKKNLSELFNIPDDKFVYADNVQNPDYVINMSGEKIDDDNIFSSEVKTFITLGRMSPEKDHVKLIKAFHAVNLKNLNTQLIILGDGPLRGEINSLVKKLNLQKHVHLLGRKTNPFPYMKKSDCFVLSSNHEGQPMVLFEAMVMKLPIIATDIVGNRGVLEGKTGLLVENSINGLISGMNSFLNEELNESVFDHEVYQKNALNMFYDQIG